MTKEQWKKIRGSQVTPDHIMLTIKGNAETQRTVTWRCDKSVECGYALFREKGSADSWQKSEASVNRFVTDVDESNYFFADMKALSPGTVYEYTVGDDKNRSEVFCFKTTKKDTRHFSFLCLSDVQTGGPEPPADYTVLGQVVRKILLEHPEIEFILTAGDNTNCGQTDVQWTGLMAGLKGIIEGVPLMMCMGNHDDMGFEDYFTFSGKYYSEHATYFTNQFLGSYNDNGPEDWHIANYAFDYGNVHFNILGTSGYEEMNAWLSEDAEKSDKPWKFAVHHFPVCYSGPAIECDDTYPALKSGLEKCDIVFSGHEHSFARSYPRRNDGLYDKPSQGTVHYNLGSGNRNPPGTRVVPKVWNAKTYCHEEDLSMYSIVKIEGNKATLTAYVEDGRIVDECVIDKENDCIFPRDPAPVYNRPRLKFKGYDAGIACENTLPQCLNGIWYIPVGQFISFIGAYVKRETGKITVGVYGKTAVFTEDSDIMTVNGEPLKMAAPCVRMPEGQLYVPVADFCKPLRMTPYYFEHNNFITVESNTEAKPVPVQP